MINISIRTRLIFLFTFQMLLFLLIGGVYLDWRMSQTLEKELDDTLIGLAKLAALQIDTDLLAGIAIGDENTRTYKNLQSQVRSIKVQSGVQRIFIFDKSQRAILDTNEDTAIGRPYSFLPITESENLDLFRGQPLTSTLFKGFDGKLYKTGFAPIFSNDSVFAAIALEGSAVTLDAIEAVRRDLILLGILVVLGSTILAFYFSKRITTPIDKLKHAADRITQGDYATPVTSVSKDEIGFLGQTLEEMRRAIVQRDTRQKTMLAGVAHEIRNPLGGIELFAGLLASELTEEKAKLEAQKIQKEVQNLKKIVNDFLDYARPQKAQKEKCLLKDLVEDVKMLLTQDLLNCKIKYLEIPSAITILADPQHLKQIFLNLIKNSLNAIKKPGWIEISAKTINNLIEIDLTDNGAGIPEEIRDRIFDPFFTNRKEGTGLGLAIVRSLLEENNGEIKLLKSSPSGTTFRISFPAVK